MGLLTLKQAVIVE